MTSRVTLLCVFFAATCLTGFAQLSKLTYDAAGNLSAAALDTQTPPQSLSGPQTRLARVGDATAFSVASSGSPPLYYQWYFNNLLIPHATNDSLSISPVGPGDFGPYYVIVANASGSVTSIVAQLQLDADGDGLADSWEIANFGSITNQNGAMDFDGDGNSNLREFQDGTSPTNHNSLLPRLVLRTIGGDVLLSPNNDRYNLGDTVTLQAVPYPGLSFLCWCGDVTGTNISTNVVMTSDKFVQATFGLPLNQVLGVTNLMITGGDGGWFGQTDDTHDGISAARSAPIIKHTSSASQSFIQTTVNLATNGTVSFWWKTDTADNYAEFLVDNNRVFNTTRQLYNMTPWTFHTSYLPTGTHTLRWNFNHSADGSSLDTGYPVVPQDSAFLDQLQMTEYTDPNLDSDGDGLPDLWEYRYFDTLNYTSADDPDGDGVNNASELADGTNPASVSSVMPRLTYLVEGGGTAVASPNLPKYSYGQTVTNTATPIAGWSFVAWRGPFLTQQSVTTKTNNPSTVQLLMSQTVRAIFGLPLPQVTDSPSLTWTNGGELGWYGQTNITLDGVSAARSAPVSATGESWMETTVQGPGTLRFYWKVDSTTNLDLLTFLLNGATQPGGISGVVDWQQQVYYLGAGAQTLRWRFKRNNGADPNRLGTAFVDEVQFDSGNVAPVFVLQPANQTVLQVSNAAVQVLARGTPTINYQLYFGSSPYGQPTSATTLFISNPPPALAGTWTMQASNAGGTTSSIPFTISVIPAPPLNDNFANRAALTVGQTNLGYNFGATKEPGEPNHDNYTGGASVWWGWTAPWSGFFRVAAQGTNILDTLVVAVYSGSSVSALTPLGVSSFNSTNYPNGDQVQVAADTFTATSGASYAIAVDTISANWAWFGLWLEYLPPPSNDMFANRTSLVGASAFATAQNRTATAEPGEPAHVGFPAANSVWWTWTPPYGGAVVLDAAGGSFLPRAAVYTGTALASLQQVAAGYGGGTNLDTVLNFNVTAGTPYQIAADGFFGSVGDIQLNVALQTPSFTSPVADAQGNFNFSVLGVPGAAFVIETSNDLLIWSPILNGTIPATGRFDFQTAILSGPRSRFYRVRM